MVGEEVALSDFEGEGENDNEGKKRMEPNKGVLRLGGSNDDDLDLVNGLFHWQMSCNLLRIDESEEGEENECPKEYREVEEGKAITAEAEGKNIQYEPNKKKDSTVRYTVNGLRKKKRLHRTTDIVTSKKTHRTVCTRNKEDGLNENFSSTERRF